MYLIEFINEERDIILRQCFKNVKDLLEVIYNLPTTMDEVVNTIDPSVSYADASVNGTLISRYFLGDLIVTLSQKGILKQFEVFENLPHSRAWEKLWIKPDTAKITAFMHLRTTSRQLLPFFAAFRVKGKTYSLENLEELPSYKLIVLKDSPGKIYMETPGDVTFFSNIEDFEPIEMTFSSSSPKAFLSIINYEEIPCPPL